MIQREVGFIHTISHVQVTLECYVIRVTTELKTTLYSG